MWNCILFQHGNLKFWLDNCTHFKFTVCTLTHCPSRGVWWRGAWPREPDPGSGDQIESAAEDQSARSSRDAAYRRGPLYVSVVERSRTWMKYGWEFMKSENTIALLFATVHSFILVSERYTRLTLGTISIHIHILTHT